MRAEKNLKNLTGPVNMFQVQMLTGVGDAQQAFADQLQQKVKGFLSSQLDGQYSTLNFPSGFNYQVTFGPNSFSNAAALRTLDSLATLGSNGIETLSSDQSFSQFYFKILQNTVYKLSAADTKTMNDALTAAQGQQQSVIGTFENDFGSITAEAITTSKCVPANKIGYIMSFVNTTYGGDVTKVPFSDFRVAYQQWKNIAAPAVAISQTQTTALARLQAAMNNVQNPGSGNGGLQTGTSSYAVGYTGLPATMSIINGLQTPSNQISISCTLSQFSSSSANFQVEGQAGFTIPLDFVRISVGGSAQYSLQEFSSFSQSISMNLTYTGVTTIGAAPAVLSLDNTTGWYDGSIVQEIVAKTGQDVTGFQLTSSEINVASTFGPGKAFARAKTLVLSQSPVVKMIFHKANANQVQKFFHEQSSVSANLFGFIPLGSVSQSYTVSSVQADSASGDVTVTFGPVVQTGTVPAEQQTCYIMGGVIQYPPGR